MEDQNLSENTQSTETQSSQQNSGSSESEKRHIWPKVFLVEANRMYYMTDEVMGWYKAGKAEFLCGTVKLEPCVHRQVDDGFHVMFNWASK